MINNIDKKFELLRKLENPLPEREQNTASIKEVGVGGFISIQGDVFYVEDIYTYKYKKEEWKELKLVSILTDKVYFLEYEEDDVITYCLSEEPLKKRDWPVSPREVEDMVEEEEGEIYYKGETYYYEDDYKAKFSRESSDEKEKVYIVEFENDNGDKGISFEIWEDGSKECYPYKVIPESYIKIIQK